MNAGGEIVTKSLTSPRLLYYERLPVRKGRGQFNPPSARGEGTSDWVSSLLASPSLLASQVVFSLLFVTCRTCRRPPCIQKIRCRRLLAEGTEQTGMLAHSFSPHLFVLDHRHFDARNNPCSTLSNPLPVIPQRSIQSTQRARGRNL